MMIHPKQSFGQHFLRDQNILHSIVAAAEIKPGDTVIEVGPGTGTLTDALLDTGAQVIAVEKDDELAARLKEKHARNENITIINDDILKFDPFEHSLEIGNWKFKIVGNIPYYLTSHLLRTILQEWPQPDLIVFTVQKEVARRMTAKPPQMNMLAVLVQYYTTPSIIKLIKAGSFYPKPAVDSAIVKLAIKPYSSTALEQERFFTIATAGFKHPRKKLGNNLPQELLEAVGIDPNRRAETLTMDEWKSLAHV